MLGCKLAELIGEREALDLVNEFIAQLIFAGCSSVVGETRVSVCY